METKKKQPVRRSGPVNKTKVDPMVWETAMELCEGDTSRLEVVSSTEVIVHNPK